MKFTKVFLREKKLPGGRKSLYLDFYPPILNDDGKRTRREFLHLYVTDRAKTEAEAEANKNARMLAEQIRAKRQLQTQSIEGGITKPTNPKADFLDYMRNLATKKPTNTRRSWLSAITKLNEFTGGTLSMGDVTPDFCERFQTYLKTGTVIRTPGRASENSLLSFNTAVLYYARFRAAVSQAFRDRYLPEDWAAKVKMEKPKEGQRQFLTFDELQLLADAPCSPEVLKRAALFSGLTGLRFSDIAKLTWSEVQEHPDGGWCILFRQKKTGNAETLPISEQAYGLLGEQGKYERPFEGLVYSNWLNTRLREWAMDAGIKKRGITFHVFRHTYATIQITKGTDIYTLSKMLGHRDIATTQIYAKVVNQLKRDAAEKIKLKI